jgi:hypothetical protein
MKYATTKPKRKLHKTFTEARKYADLNDCEVVYVGPYDETICYKPGGINGSKTNDSQDNH